MNMFTKINFGKTTLTKEIEKTIVTEQLSCIAGHRRSPVFLRYYVRAIFSTLRCKFCLVPLLTSSIPESGKRGKVLPHIFSFLSDIFSFFSKNGEQRGFHHNETVNND